MLVPWNCAWGIHIIRPIRGDSVCFEIELSTKKQLLPSVEILARYSP
jgi:hypothetical protein